MWRSSQSSRTPAPEPGTPLTVLAIGVLAAVAVGNLMPPARIWALPLVPLAVATGYLGLRRSRLGWWLACGGLLGAAACSWAPRIDLEMKGQRLPARFVGSVRDGWSAGAFGFTNRLRLEELEIRGARGPRWRELRIEVAAGQATASELPAPGQRIAGSGELLQAARFPLSRPALKVESSLLLRVVEGGATVDRWREAGVAATLRAAGTDVRRIWAAGLASALFFGRQELLRSGEVATLRMSGLAHLLAVSGLNVGLVGMVVWTLLLALGVRPPVRRLVVVAAVLAFSLISGGFAPVRRAAGAAAVYLLARHVGRPLEPLPVVWGIVAGLVLLEPDALLSPGFQLSAGVTLALVRWVGPVSAKLSMMPKMVADALAVALVAQAAAMPLVGAHFAFVPPFALLANLAVAPLTLAMTALSMVASLAALALPAAGAAALDGVALCQRVLDAVATATAGGSIAFPPPGAAALVIFCGAALVALGRSKRAAAAAIALIAGVLVWVAAPGLSGRAANAMTMLPVSDGMSLLITTPGGSVVVDGGRSPREAGRALSDQRAGDIAAVVVTHPDADHIGGVGRILEWRRPGMLILPEQVAAHSEVVALRRLARRLGVVERLVGAGERVNVGALALDVLWPVRGFTGDDNDASLIFAVRLGGARALVTGDIEAAGERALVAGRVPLRAALLQLPHHGSRTSSTREFLAAVDPVVALAASGERPRYRYPHGDTVRRLRERRILILAQTAGFGAVKVSEGDLVVDTRSPVRVKLQRQRR